MYSLFAVAFDKYTSSRTTEGVIYNIVDQDNVVWVQYLVSHRRYTLHDLLIENISGAPNSMRVEFEKVLNEILGKDNWEIKTVFGPKVASRSNKLRQSTFSNKCTFITYSNEENRVTRQSPFRNPQIGII
jgi:hypothetical protein